MGIKMDSPHLFPLGTIPPQTVRSGGTRSDAKAKELAALKGMSLSLLALEPKGVREPHWHPNANELSYCMEGSGLMTIFSPGAGHNTFTIKAGEIAFVPMGFLHHIENTGHTKLRLLICFDHENAEDLDLSSGVSAMPNHIMAETFGINPSFFEGLNKNIKGLFISERQSPAVPPLPFMTDRYKMDLESAHPQVETKGGSVKMSNKFLFQTLEGLAVYSVLLKPKGAREPHWHPNASELNYLIKGNARITLLSPGGIEETFDMKAGDMSFLPRGYLHHIENIGSDDAQFAIFFNHSAPSDIGFSGSLGAYSNEVLASLFGVSSQYFENLPKLQQDLFVIGGG